MYPDLILTCLVQFRVVQWDCVGLWTCSEISEITFKVISEVTFPFAPFCGTQGASYVLSSPTPLSPSAELPPEIVELRGLEYLSLFNNHLEVSEGVRGREREGGKREGGREREGKGREERGSEGERGKGRGRREGDREKGEEGRGRERERAGDGGNR